jgi:hypothetical protein
MKDRLSDIQVSTGDLLKRGKRTLWERILRHPEAKDLFPVCFFKDAAGDDYELPEPTEEFPETPDEFKKCVKALDWFCGSLPRRRAPEAKDFEEGVAGLMFAVQYHQFPWFVINVRPPSCFLEQEDVEMAERE